MNTNIAAGLDTGIDESLLSFDVGSATGAPSFVPEPAQPRTEHWDGSITICRATSALTEWLEFTKTAWHWVPSGGFGGGWSGISFVTCTAPDDAVALDSSVDVTDNVSYCTSVIRAPKTELIKWVFEDGERLNRFLVAYPAVKRVLEAMQPDIAAVFGLGTEVALEIMPPYEAGSQEELVAWILSDEEIESGLALFDGLAEQWDDRIWDATRGRLCLSIISP